MVVRPSIAAVLTILAATIACHAGDAPKPVRIATGVKGHIHPAVCLSKKGTIVVIFSQSDMKDLRVSRSSDAGKTWTTPEPFEPSAKQSIYPGSLTALADGQIVHAWNVWYNDENKKKSRYVELSISSDEGKTWSKPYDLPKNPTAESIIRHPFVELPRGWLCPLSDGAVVLESSKDTQKVGPFDKEKHGLVPIVRTTKGTFVSGKGMRTTDAGKTWEKVAPFPDIAKQGWRHEMMTHSNGWIIASDIDGIGIGGGTRLAFVVSKDDGKTWDLKNPLVYYNPGRPIGGRACPRTIELDAKTLGTVFYDGSEVFFLQTPLARFKEKP
ncbi:MAG: exo-alpha-sialidase [Planctomycetes bacterium]|nr:exo-alpha-sialidase [Planctomycetota bacterium]